MNIIDKFTETFGFSNNKEMLKVLKLSCFSNGYTPFNMESILVLIQKSLEKELDPFSGDVYVVEQKDSAGVEQGYSAEIGMNGWLTIANRQPDYEGVEFESSNTMIQYESNLLHLDGSPIVVTGLTWITAKIFIKGIPRPFVATEYLDECFSPYSQAWVTKPKRRLRKTCFGQAVELAFHGRGEQKKRLNYSMSESDLNEFDELINSLGFELVLEPSKPKKTMTKENNSVVEFLNNQPEAKVEAETKVEAKAETKVEAKAETKVEAKAETKVEAKAETKAETKVEAEEFADIEVIAEALAKAEADEEAAIKAEIEAEKLAEIEAEAKAEADEEAAIKAEIEAEALAEMLVEARAVAFEEAEVEALAEIEAEAEAFPQVEGNAQVVAIDSVDAYLSNKVNGDTLMEFDKRDFVFMFIEEFTETPSLVTNKQLSGFLRQMEGVEQQWAMQQMHENGLIDKNFVCELLDFAM